MSSRKTRIDWPRVLLDACRRIERAAGDVRLAQLGAALGVSAFELQRQFRRRLGTSPKAYSQALALNRLTRGIAQTETTLEATLGAGFESTSAAYSSAGSALGVSPGRLRRPIEIGWWLGLSDLGWMLMAATPRGICWLAFGEAPGALLQDLRAAFPPARLSSDEARLRKWFDAVRDFILLPKEALDLPLDVQGTAFQSRVWRALRKVPLGETVSYAAVARSIAQPAASRAVASACARNPVALVIPCHRVISAGGGLAGYRWGVQRKAKLLRRERGAGEAAS
jgi:AraC family transcriptional regulator of adaptative response/methylated-DNA-[protein]-cysteine methyltransferase